MGRHHPRKSDVSISEGDIQLSSDDLIVASEQQRPFTKVSKVLDDKDEKECENIDSFEPSAEEDGEVEHSGEPSRSIFSSGERSLFLSFLKQLATAKGDLVSISSPAFVLSGLSVLEYNCGWLSHPDAFLAIDKANSQLDRMVALVRWLVIATWDAFGKRNSPNGRVEKKPYNPILGEQFRCYWELPTPPEENDTTHSYGNRVTLISEQVSHHPPIMAFFFEHPLISLSGYTSQSLKYKGNHLRVNQKGHTEVTLARHGETYKFDPPILNMRGLLSGKIFCELFGSILVQCEQSEYEARIDYLPKPWFSGQYHNFDAVIYSKNNKGHPLYRIHGNWHKSTIITNVKSGSSSVLCDVTQATPSIEPVIAPVDEQSANESQKVWRKVTDALIQLDWARAAAEKHSVEEEQRALRRERERQNIQWTPVHFKHDGTHWVYVNKKSSNK